MCRFRNVEMWDFDKWQFFFSCVSGKPLDIDPVLKDPMAYTPLQTEGLYVTSMRYGLTDKKKVYACQGSTLYRFHRKENFSLWDQHDYRSPNFSTGVLLLELTRTPGSESDPALHEARCLQRFRLLIKCAHFWWSKLRLSAADSFCARQRKMCAAEVINGIGD